MTLRILACLLAAALVLWVCAASGYAASRGIAVQVRTAAGGTKSMQLYSGYHALVIGASAYNRGWPRLRNAVADAREVAERLRRAGWSVDLLEDPDSATLNRSLNSLIAGPGRDAEKAVLVWFSGHGHTLREADGTPLGYIVPVDAPLASANEVEFMGKAVDMRTMETVARRIASKHVLMVFDSCFSGSLFNIQRAAPSDYIQEKAARPVRQFLAAGSESEQVPDKSVFKTVFLQGFGEGDADRNRDGYVTGDELGAYVEEKVVNYTRSAQHPQFGRINNPKLDKGDFVFVLPSSESPPGPDLEAERRKLEEERRQAESALAQAREDLARDKASLAEQQRREEEQRKLEAEKERLAVLEAERRKMDAERRKLEEERERLKRQTVAALEPARVSPPVASRPPAPVWKNTGGRRLARIAVAAPLSGPAAAYGENVKAGVDMKVAEVNAQGGVDGLRFEVVPFDEGCDPKQAASVALGIVRDRDIVAVVGHVCSSAHLAALPSYVRGGVPVISATATNGLISGQNRDKAGRVWSFRDVYRDDFQGRFLARYAKKALGLSRVAVFYDKNDYGTGLKDAFVDEAGKIGLEVAGAEGYARGDKDFTPQLARFKASRVQGLFLAGFYQEGALIAAQARKLGLDTPKFGADGFDNADYVKLAGEAAEDTYLSTPFIASAAGPAGQAFAAAFSARYGREADYMSANAYDAAGILIQAVSQVGPDRERIRDYLAGMDAPASGYGGAVGRTHFDRNGDSQRNPHVKVVSNGRFVTASTQY